MGLRNTNHSPPFVYFGGKSPVANVIWQALGDPLNYVEPFCGSAAVLLLRDKPGHIETINDADGFVANTWRAIKTDPEGVAEYADNIVSEVDLHARHLWLIGQREPLTDRLCGDTEFYDVRAAGYWLYGINCWIGSGWCSGKGPWQSIDGEMVNVKADAVRNPGQGVNRKRPHLGNPGQGVNRQLPHLGDPGKEREPETPGECEKRREWLIGYLRTFADRLRNVRICCGDWSRVCGPSVTFRHGLTGVFLDPPYADSAERTANLYATDCEQVAHAARKWAIQQGENPLMRIVLAGYSGEHEMPHDWRVIEWEAAGGYGLQAVEENETGATGRANSKRERLWMSPHCLKSDRPVQMTFLE